MTVLAYAALTQADCWADIGLRAGGAPMAATGFNWTWFPNFDTLHAAVLAWRPQCRASALVVDRLGDVEAVGGLVFLI